MTTFLNDRERLKLAIDQAVREQSKTPLQRSRERNDEIVRQYVENGIRTEQIADLMGMPNWRVREVLRRRGVHVGVRRPRIDEHGCIYVPAEIRRRIKGKRFTSCELVEDGLLYRRVDEADRGAAA